MRLPVRVRLVQVERHRVGALRVEREVEVDPADLDVRAAGLEREAPGQVERERVPVLVVHRMEEAVPVFGEVACGVEERDLLE